MFKRWSKNPLRCDGYGQHHNEKHDWCQKQEAQILASKEKTEQGRKRKTNDFGPRTVIVRNDEIVFTGGTLKGSSEMNHLILHFRPTAWTPR